MVFKFKKILLTTFLAATLLIHPQIACAQFEGKVSSNEDVAMAFFKTGNTKPDFELWARNSKNYKVQPPTHALRYIEDEKQRLIKAWQKYDPESNTIILQTKVDIELEIRKDENSTEPAYWVYISLPQRPPLYFPYFYQNYLFAVIPLDIERLMVQKITRSQFDLIKNDFKDAVHGQAWLRLGLKPKIAHMDQPYDIDGQERWVLMADVVNMALTSRQTGSPYWYYVADWYVTPKARELNGLYEEHREKVEENKGLTTP